MISDLDTDYCTDSLDQCQRLYFHQQSSYGQILYTLTPVAQSPFDFSKNSWEKKCDQTKSEHLRLRKVAFSPYAVRVLISLH